MRFGCLRVGPGFAVLFSLLYFLDNDGVFAGVVLAAMMHEAGHVIMIYMLGGRMFEAELTIAGACIHHSLEEKGWRDIAIALSGPVFNIISAFVFAGKNGLAGIFAAASLLLGLYNLLPVYPLDGGRVLKAIFGRREKAERILAVCALLPVSALLGIGTVLALKGYGLAFLETGISTAFVYTCSWKKGDV